MGQSSSTMRHLHVFVTGCTNSGTGMLRNLLGEHPQVSALPKEGHSYAPGILPRDRGPETKRLFALYPRKFRWGKDRVAITQSQKLRNRFYRKWDTTKPVLMEKSPHNMLRLQYMAEVFKPARFICIVRNGYVVAEGLKRRKGHSIARAAMQWQYAHQFMLEDQKNLFITFVRYENLVKDTQNELDRLWRFIMLPPHPIDLDKPIERQNSHKQHYSLRDAPDFDAEAIARLTAKEKSEIKRIAGSMLEHWGYDA